ncbi:hypothetical protein GQR58_026730 [Nymphon striatum]|nr:hypothetical protein GQR58_026730 [Nymphon striatum]
MMRPESANQVWAGPDLHTGPTLVPLPVLRMWPESGTLAGSMRIVDGPRMAKRNMLATHENQKSENIRIFRTFNSNKLSGTQARKKETTSERTESNKKAVAKYRMKKSSEDTFKNSESKRVEKIRKRRLENMNEEEQTEYKRKAAERKKKSREAKKLSNNANDAKTPEPTAPVPYKRVQSLRKAINKSLRSLPYSPNKRKVVVAGLAKCVGLKIQEQLKAGLGGQMPLSEETIKFAHQIFCELYPDHKIGFSKFYELRPENVLLMKETPADQSDEKITNEIIWSDGPSSEFKNKFTMQILKDLGEKLGKSFTWKFSATSHGKGIIDGIGGRAKYLVRHKVMSKSSTPLIIQNSQDFANAANQLMEKTTVIHISQRQINEFNEKYDGFKNVEAYPGISKCHIPSYSFPDKALKLKKHALDYDQQISEISVEPTQQQVYTINEWVLVRYMGLSYPGEVTYTESSQIRVNVMEKAGTHYKWPNMQDNIFYSYDDVIMKLAPPVVAGNRGQFLFEDLKKYQHCTIALLFLGSLKNSFNSNISLFLSVADL